MTVLRYVDYYSEEEIDALAGTIESLDTQNASERLKLRADNFLSNKRYSNAVHNYEIIVYGQKDINLSDDFTEMYGIIWEWRMRECLNSAMRCNVSKEHMRLTAMMNH